MSQQEKTAEIISLNAQRATAPSGESVGEFLAAARAAAGLGLDEVSAGTKIKLSHLEAIEASNPDALPATPYAVGFVKVYAAFLGLDVVELARRFREEIAAASASDEPEKTSPTSVAPGDAGNGVRLASLLGIGAVLLFAAWIAIQISANADRDETRIAQAEPRVRVGGEAAPAPRPRVLAPVQPANDEENLASSREEAAQLSVADEGAPVDEGEAEATEAPVASEENETPVLANLTADVVDTAVDDPEPVEALPERVEPTPTVERVEPEPRRTRPAAPRPAQEPVIVEAQLTRSVAPVYPSRCDYGAATFENVSIVFDVMTSGQTANARVVSTTNACFNDAALTAVSRWRFTPKTVDGAARIDTGKKATLNFQR